jgi:hypothetical protein
MIDDTGLLEFNGSSRARRQVFTLAAISLAAACVETLPADDAVVAELSSGQVLALCDELRDAVQRDDQLIQCDAGDKYWVLPSNESCRSADLSACAVTVGELRRCHELTRQDPCSLANDPLSPVDLSPIDPGTGLAECESLDGCYPLVPTTDYAYALACSAVALESLQTIDGVYEVTFASQPEASRCPGALPQVIEMDAPRFVLASTEASGVAEVLLQSCTEVPDCQALAREIRAAAAPRGATPYNHLLGCETPFNAESFALVFVPPDAASCHAAGLPEVSVAGGPASLRVTISSLANPPEVSPGCGYVIQPSRATEVCEAFAEYRAVRVSAL